MTKECECAAHSAAECCCGAWDTPPQRTWVGLTHQERNAIRCKYWIGMSDAVFNDIEDILKDKNNG